MAMDENILGAAIDSAVNAIATSPTSPGYSLEVWTAVSAQLISHIQTYGSVSVTSNGATGVSTPGGPLPISSLPGSGTVS